MRESLTEEKAMERSRKYEERMRRHRKQKPERGKKRKIKEKKEEWKREQRRITVEEPYKDNNRGKKGEKVVMNSCAQEEKQWKNLTRQ